MLFSKFNNIQRLYSLVYIISNFCDDSEYSVAKTLTIFPARGTYFLVIPNRFDVSGKVQIVHNITSCARIHNQLIVPGRNSFNHHNQKHNYVPQSYSSVDRTVKRLIISSVDVNASRFCTLTRICLNYLFTLFYTHNVSLN